MKWINNWQNRRKKRSQGKRGCCCLFTLIVLAFILACAALLVLLYNAYAQGGGVDQASTRPLDVVLVLDHSDSMWELGGVGSDPNLLRVDAADLFISYLGVDAGATGHRLAVVHFGTAAELIVPLGPLGDAGQRAGVRQAIASPQRMGWTDPLAALTLVYDELFDSPRTDPTHRPAVVLLSDGKPERSTDPDPAETAAYLADLRALVDRFRERDCPVFTIALANAATDADPDIQTVYRNLWQELAARSPPAEYHEARTPEDLLRVYHDVVARLSGVEVMPPAIETELGGAVAHRVPVREGLARLTLVILKTEPSVRASVLRPSGLVLRASDPDVRYAGQPGKGREEVWAVTMPRPGDWMVELDGQGYVIVWKDVVPLPAPTPAPAYTFDLLAPAVYVPDDAPLRVAVRLRDETGEPLRDPVQVTVELRRAGFPEVTLLARDDGTEGDEVAGDGILTARHPNPAPGAYTLYLRVLQGGKELAHWEGACEIVALPHLEALSPTPGESLSFRPGQPVTAQVRIVAGFTVLADAALSSFGTLTATLIDPAGDARPLDVVAMGDSFGVEIPAPPSAGNHAITFHLAGRTPQGLSFVDTLSCPFRVLLPPTATPVATPTLLPAPAPESPSRRSLWPWVLAIGGVKLVGLLGTGYWIVQRRMPRLEGSLRVLDAPPGQPSGHVLELPLDRRQVALGGNELPLPGRPGGTWAPPTLRATRDQAGKLEILLSPAPTGPGCRESRVTVNDRPLALPHSLQDGDVIATGDWRLRYENLGQVARRPTRPAPRRPESGGGPRTGFMDVEGRCFDESQDSVTNVYS